MAVKSAVYDYSLYTPDYYLKGFLAGGVCCSVTHGGATPIDFVKTRMQLVPELGSKGLFGATKEIIATEGAGALTTGMSATAAAYALQGSFKFGGFEFFKVNLAQAYGDQGAWDNRFLLNSISAACAEFIADIFLSPLDSTRIRQVSDAEMASMSMPGAFTHILKQDGFITGFYSGFVPLLFKQIPYTIAKFVVQDEVANRIYRGLGAKPSEMSPGKKLGISCTSGFIAGVFAAICSHPADTLFSLMNKPGAGSELRGNPRHRADVVAGTTSRRSRGAPEIFDFHTGGEGSMFARMSTIAGEMGFYKLATQGLGARCIMIGGLTAGQFAIFDSMLPAIGIDKFHYHEPHVEH